MRKILCLLLAVQMVLLNGCNIYYGYSAPSRDARETEESAKAEESAKEDESAKEEEPVEEPVEEPTPVSEEEEEEPAGPVIEVTENVTELADGLSVTEFRGDYGFEKFIARGGVASDEDLIRFLADTLMPGIGSFLLKMAGFGCSTISVESREDGYYFGRNFDWSECDKQILFSYPDKGYASVSTVNIGFIESAAGNMSIPENVLKMAALYTPLDGMNEKGLCVAVNMIEDNATIDQNTDKPDVTTTTAVRLLLNKAADTKEAVELLKGYDMHASFGYMVHFAIADAKGDAVAAEYIDNKLVITETPVLTNFYVSEGKKYGIGTEQSHERFDVLQEKLSGVEEGQMTRAQVRDALEAASKKNFSDTERTEWSIVYDQKNLTAEYYNREDFEKGYLVEIRK